MPVSQSGKKQGSTKKKAANGEGSIYRRTRNGVTKWHCEIVTGFDSDGKKVRLRSSASSYEEVRAWRIKHLADKQAGTLVKPSKESVAHFLDVWLQETVPMQVGPSTIRLYSNLVSWYVRPRVGSTPLAQFGPKQIQRLFHDLLQEGKSARTVQLVRVVLRKALQQAVEWGELPRNPVDLVKPPRQEHKEMQVLEPDQVVRFIEAAKSERLHALFILAVLTGLRKGELLALRWQDINFTAGTLSVSQTMKVELVRGDDGRQRERWVFGQTKTKAGRRTINVPAVALSAIRRWRKEQEWEMNAVGGNWERPELVFVSEVGTPLHPRNLKDRGFKRILQRASLPTIRFHDLRHSFATLMADQGVSDLVMQKVMGHSSITITKTLYAHVLERQKEEAAQKVDAFLAAAEKKAR